MRDLDPDDPRQADEAGFDDEMELSPEDARPPMAQSDLDLLLRRYFVLTRELAAKKRQWEGVRRTLLAELVGAGITDHDVPQGVVRVRRREAFQVLHREDVMGIIMEAGLDDALRIDGHKLLALTGDKPDVLTRLKPHVTLRRTAFLWTKAAPAAD